ncbi:MAG: hypothetical protein QM703_18145 [Gemmatales bacterium]
MTISAVLDGGAGGNAPGCPCAQATLPVPKPTTEMAKWKMELVSCFPQIGRMTYPQTRQMGRFAF